jgi:outer membrane cobalamin receptor
VFQLQALPSLAAFGLSASLIFGIGQERRLEEHVVVTAAAYPIPFESMARTVHVITREQIERLPVRSIAELLNYAAGFDLQSRGPFGIQADLSLRGSAFSQVLVLIDGVRINDSQTAHHNADFPVQLQDLERVEILLGPGSSVHGADALGGAINLITLSGGGRGKAAFSLGEHGLQEAGFRLPFQLSGITQVVSASGIRSSGFMPNRDFRTVAVSSKTEWHKTNSFAFSHVGKEFGAAGFYGPSPSREWTGQTLASYQRTKKGVTAGAHYRMHSDRFLWDVRHPDILENTHRTHSAGMQLKTQLTVNEQTSLSLGGETGGDWISSSNLGKHGFVKNSLFGEIQWKRGQTAVVSPGLRYDNYSRFGSAFSPGASAAVWVSPRFRLRSSAGHAFRVPTFTELYYRDPGHEGGRVLLPEKAWGAEAAADWLPGPGWMGSFTFSSRSEKDVIDWVRENASDKWISANLRARVTRAWEMNLHHVRDSGHFLEIQYIFLSSTAPSVDLLSKYALDFARHSWSAAGALALPWGLNLGQRTAYRLRSVGMGYWVVDARLSRRFGQVLFRVDGSNMLNRQYQAVRGVDMPGRWLQLGIDVELPVRP